MSAKSADNLVWVNKTADSRSLSHSQGDERVRVFQQARRSRHGFVKKSSGRVRGVRDKGQAQEVEKIGIVREDKIRPSRKQAGYVYIPVMWATPAAASFNRLALAGHFLDSYYPTGMPGRVDVISKLRQWVEPVQGPAATAAADGVILLHAAHASGSSALRGEGILRYHLALQLLRDRVQSPDSIRDDTLLGAVEALCTIEKLIFSYGDQESMNVAHMRGLQALVVARGPDTMRSDIARDILLQHLHSPLMGSLLTRKASVFGNRDWQAAFEAVASKGKISRLAALGCCIPTAFEKADRLFSDDTSTSSQYVDLLAECVLLEERFEQWLMDRYENISGMTPYCVTSPFDSPLFYDQPAALRDMYPFPHVIDHSSFIEALAHLNYWLLRLMLSRTMLDLASSLADSAMSSSSILRQRERLLNGCYDLADSFCESAIYTFCLPIPQNSIAQQAVVAFLMTVIIPWYSQNHDAGKVKWCSALVAAIQDEDKQIDLDLVETTQLSWITKHYIGWIIMAF